MQLPACPRCGNCHVGVLIFAPLGFRVLFRNDWEQNLSEQDFNSWNREFVGIVKIRSASLRDFVGFANS